MIRTWGLAAVIVNWSGVVPSDGAAGRGRVNAYVPPLPAVPGCAHAPVSPLILKQTLDASTPA